MDEKVIPLAAPVPRALPRTPCGVSRQCAAPVATAQVGFGACEELAAAQATDRGATRIEARPFGHVIWLQL
jgi:hypothetical protein